LLKRIIRGYKKRLGCDWEGFATVEGFATSEGFSTGEGFATGETDFAKRKGKFWAILIK
jgi:hypothetical protein